MADQQDPNVAATNAAETNDEHSPVEPVDPLGYGTSVLTAAVVVFQGVLAEVCITQVTFSCAPANEVAA